MTFVPFMVYSHTFMIFTPLLVCLHLHQNQHMHPTPIPTLIPDNMQKSYTVTDTDGATNGKLQWKLSSSPTLLVSIGIGIDIGQRTS